MSLKWKSVPLSDSTVSSAKQWGFVSLEELEESEDIGQSVEAPAVITVTPSADLASAVKESGEQKTALKSLSKKKKKKRKRKRVPDAVEGAQSRQGAPKKKKKKRRKATDNSENSTSTEVLPEDEQLSESEVREKMRYASYFLYIKTACIMFAGRS